jgi:hypothetical protein
VGFAPSPLSTAGSKKTKLKRFVETLSNEFDKLGLLFDAQILTPQALRDAKRCATST